MYFHKFSSLDCKDSLKKINLHIYRYIKPKPFWAGTSSLAGKFSPAAAIFSAIKFIAKSKIQFRQKKCQHRAQSIWFTSPNSNPAINRPTHVRNPKFTTFGRNFNQNLPESHHLSNGGPQTLNGGPQTSNGGLPTSNDGLQTLNDGPQTSNGGPQTSNDGPQMSNGGHQTSNGDHQTSNGGHQMNFYLNFRLIKPITRKPKGILCGLKSF